jgi:long-chain acyl-CoA synthetase
MNVINNLEKNSRKFPDKDAVIFEDKKISYKELYQKVQKFSLPNVKKQVVSLISENSLSFIITYLGIINTGKIVHIASPNILENDLFNQIESANSCLIICSEKVFDNISKYSKIKIPILKFSELKTISNIKKNNYKENKIAHLIYTSGTTSEPKGVGISHSMIEFTTKNIIDILDYSSSDIDVLPLPLNHSFGLGCFHVSMTIGSTLILHKDASNLQYLLESIMKFNATTVASIPATLTKFLKLKNTNLEDYFLNIRLVITNSTTIPKNTIQSFRKILKNGNLATYYGLTEASRSTFMIFQEDIARDDSVGKPAPGVNIRIENNQNSTGEIMVKGKNVISNYWNNKIADRNFMDGWLKTGDIGYLDKENFLFLKGRKDDIVNVGGEKVIPEEIEVIVKQLPDVEDVAAFGIENEIFGQVIKLHVIKTTESDLDKSKILIHCMKNLEKFKIPTKIDFVEKIPKTSYGKVKRFMLK